MGKTPLNSEQRMWLVKLSQDFYYGCGRNGTMELVNRILEDKQYNMRDAYLLNVYIIPAYVEYLKEEQSNYGNKTVKR